MSAPAAKVSKKELNSNHDGADETSGEEQARRGPARAAIFAARPARRPPAGPGARAGGRWADGPARASAPFFVRAGPGPGWRRGGGRRCEAGALRPARRGRRRPPLPLPPPSLSSPSLPPEKPLFIVLRHDASLPSAAAAATWCGRTRPRGRASARLPLRARPAGGAPRTRTRTRRPAPARPSASSWGGVGARGRTRLAARWAPAAREDAPAGRGRTSHVGRPPPPRRSAGKAGPAAGVSEGLYNGSRRTSQPGRQRLSRQGGCETRDGYRK